MILCPVFLFSFLIIRLEGFSLVTWPFETHQLLYGVKIFSMISRFLFPVFFIGLRGFLSGSHFFFQWFSHLAELASKKRGNCNNVTLRARTKSFQNRNYVTTIISDFILVTLTSTITLHPVKLPLRTAFPSHPMYSTTYILNFSLFT